jgi:signal peptidase
VRVISGIVLALLAAAALVGAALTLVLHLGFAPVLSPSMEPAFSPGDLVVTRPVAAADVRVGDVVVLPRPDAPGERYAHRVVEADGPVVRTKGDANAAADPQKLRIVSETVPVVVADVPAVGRVALLGGNAWVRIGIILVIGTAVLVAAKRALYRPSPETVKA